MMKVWYIVSVIAVILVVEAGIIFLFMNDVFVPVYDDKGWELRGDFDMEDTDEKGSISENNSEREENNNNETTGTESSDGDNSEEITDATNCEMQQIQYSLRNFINNAECTDTGANGCTRLVVNCSVEVHNLDKETEGIFGIRYSLVDSDDKELDFELVQKNVQFDIPEIFSVGFIISDISGVDENSACSFSMETIPKREICS